MKTNQNLETIEINSIHELTLIEFTILVMEYCVGGTRRPKYNIFA